MSEENKGGLTQFKFTYFLKFFAIVSGLCGVKLGMNEFLATEFRQNTGWLYIIGGFAAFLLWWSFAIIVEAARRYLERTER